MADDHFPARCASCGAAIALDELKHVNNEWASRQSFDDWDVVADSDIIEHVMTATFVGLHPSFAGGCVCPSWRYPFTIGDLSDAYVDPFAGEEDPF
jgi:hypothetical protein